MFPKMDPSPSLFPQRAQLFYADTVHQRIEENVNTRMKELKEGQSLSVEVILHDRRIMPTFFGYHNPNFILVYGEDDYGNEVEALISHTEIQIAMTVLNKPTKKKPIVFQSRKAESDRKQS